jgi:hypothetical protein
MDYHYQGKKDAYAKFSISDDWLTTNIYEPLKTAEKIVNTFTVEIFDNDGNLLATGYIDWHVKSWDKVKTSIN